MLKLRMERLAIKWRTGYSRNFVMMPNSILIRIFFSWLTKSIVVTSVRFLVSWLRWLNLQNVLELPNPWALFCHIQGTFLVFLKMSLFWGRWILLTDQSQWWIRPCVAVLNSLKKCQILGLYVMRLVKLVVLMLHHF